MTPKISVIVPCWNVEKYLDRCVESIVNQTLKDIEIILVDDESPDCVPKMCDEWAKKDNRIKVIHKKNAGLGMARNSGIEVATGEYITFCDSDDWIEPEAYEIVYKKCVDNNLDMCSFQYRRVDAEGNCIEKKKDVVEEIFDNSGRMHDFVLGVIGKDYSNKSSRAYGMSSCMALFRKDIYIKSGVRYPSEREIASEDFVFLLYFLPHVKRAAVIPDVFYNYLLNPSSISSSFNEAKRARLVNLLDEVKYYCDNNFEWDDYKNHYYSQVLRIVKVIMKFTSYKKDSFINILKALRGETYNTHLQQLYADKARNDYPLADRLYIWMLKHHCGLFFYLLYNYVKKTNSKNDG